MEINKIYCENNLETMKKMNSNFVDCVITSPFYNTNKKAGHNRTLLNTKAKQTTYNYVRYDNFVDNMSNQDYNDYTINLFTLFDKILKQNGTVLYNISYGSDNADGMFSVINEIITKTNFTIADCIIWKKKSALPNSVSPNKLTRICEFIFVFCRKSEYYSFIMNKNIISERPNGQKLYSVFYNFIEAKNNDEVCPYNKATFSTDLVKQLLDMYVVKNGLVYDPFSGTGTTACACKELGYNYIGSEISENQVKWSIDRLNKTLYQPSLFD